MNIQLHTLLLLVFLFFFNITKSNAQREIHPLEPTFTYDYAFKYYGNLTLGDYWSLDNFKAPKGVKSIEQYESFFHDSARSRAVHYYEWKKRIYYYNKDTGFLEGTTTIDRYNKKVLAQAYKYKTDSLHLIINVEHFSFDEKSNKAVQQTVQQYIYDLKTENLIKIIYHKNTKNEQSIRYTYDENQKDLIDIKIDSTSTKQKISISYDTIKPIDKIKFSIRIGKKYKFKNDSIYLNKEETLVNLSRRKLALKKFSTGYRTINNGKSNREYYENLSQTESNYIVNP